MKIRILFSRITLALIFICSLTVAYAQSSSEAIERENFNQALSTALENARAIAARGDPASAQESVVEVVTFAEMNKTKTAEVTPEALLHGAEVSNTSIETMDVLTAYRDRKTDTFLTTIIHDTAMWVKEQSDGQGYADWGGEPTSRIQAAVGWREHLVNSEQYGKLMQNAYYQRAAGSAVLAGFNLGGDDQCAQNAFTLGLLESAARFSLNKSPDVHARYVNAMVDGVRVALSKNNEDENGRPIQGTGFSGTVALSPSAVLGIMAQITTALSERANVNPAQLTAVMASAFNTYSSLIDSDAAYFADPETYTAIGEIAVNMALRPLGLGSSLSRVARNYLSVSSGRELAVASMERAARDRGDSYIATSGAFSIIAQGISKKVMPLALNNENKPAWDAMQEAGMTFADLIAYASDPNDGHKKLRGMTANDGSRVFTDNTLSVFKREVFLGVETAAMQRSQTTGLNYDTEKVKLFASIFHVDMDTATKLDKLD